MRTPTFLRQKICCGSPYQAIFGLGGSSLRRLGKYATKPDEDTVGGYIGYCSGANLGQVLVSQYLRGRHHMDAQIERWTERYDNSEGYLFGKEPNAFLVSQKACFAPGMKVLSVADGEGRNSVWLAQQGADVLAVEAVPRAVEKARQLAAERGVTVSHACVDLLTWDWGDERFDAIVAIFIQFVGPEQRAQMFANMQRALKPGGVLLIEGYGPGQLGYATGGPKDPANLYSTELLAAAFSDLQILHLAEYDAHIEEGSGHSGMSALIDLRARKPEAPPSR